MEGSNWPFKYLTTKVHYIFPVICTRSVGDLCFIDFFQVRRGSLLSRPHSVLQKLASISEGNPLAPRNSRGFLFQTLSPEKSNSTSDAPQKQMMKKKRGPVEAVNPAAKRICRENKPAGQTKASQRSIFNFLDH